MEMNPSGSSRPVHRQVALLRGINLGGRRRVEMARLRGLLESAGHRDVRTYLQSGNVVLTSPSPSSELETQLVGLIAGEFGLDVPVIVRTRDELAHVVARNPFGAVADDPAKYQVTFLAAEPEAAVVRELEAADVAPERVAVEGREVYAWHPDGIGRSALAKLLTADRLGVEATARNWKTIAKLLELADAS